MSIIKSIILLFLLFAGIIFAQEKKESVYICLDKGTKNVQNTQSKSIIFSFKKDIIKNKRHHTSYFVYNATIDTLYKVKYTEIENKLISINEAITKVEDYLASKAKECEKQYGDSDTCNVIRYPPVYNYDTYFDKIYIFEKANNNEGILYEVTWRYFIVD